MNTKTTAIPKTSAAIGKTELVRRLAEKMQVPITQADNFVSVYNDLLTEILAEGTI